MPSITPKRRRQRHRHRLRRQSAPTCGRTLRHSDGRTCERPLRRVWRPAAPSSAPPRRAPTVPPRTSSWRNGESAPWSTMSASPCTASGLPSRPWPWRRFPKSMDDGRCFFAAAYCSRVYIYRSVARPAPLTVGPACILYYMSASRLTSGYLQCARSDLGRLLRLQGCRLRGSF